MLLIDFSSNFFSFFNISFLGCVDKIGVAFEAPTVATGFGAYLAQVFCSPVI